jgi:hypothetical protein
MTMGHKYVRSWRRLIVLALALGPTPANELRRAHSAYLPSRRENNSGAWEVGRGRVGSVPFFDGFRWRRAAVDGSSEGQM